MHVQSKFLVQDRAEIIGIIQAYPLGTISVNGLLGLAAHPLPLECVDEDGSIYLRGHVPKNHGLIADAASDPAVMVVFQGPNAYISPRWYVNGQRSKTVAPSWNFISVQARGSIRFIDDQSWVQGHLVRLTDGQEAARKNPWSIDEADSDFISQISQRLRGFEILVSDIQGKRFMSQQRTTADRINLIEQLVLEPAGAARDVAKLIAP